MVEEDEEDEDDWADSLDGEVWLDELVLIWEAELLIFSLDGLVSLRRWPHVRLDLSVVFR